MTESKKNLIPTWVIVTTLLCCIALMLIFSNTVILGVIEALRLCATTIIPSLFPFMVASDLLIACRIAELHPPRWIEAVCQRLFRVSAVGLYAFLLGAICGFPIGIKFVADLYRSRQIDLTEAERLICFCNNTGPAFIIAGIGGSLFGSPSFGIVLYVVQIVVSLLCGFVFVRLPVKDRATNVVAEPPKSPHGFVGAVRNSVQNTLVVCGFVVLFATLAALLAMIVKNSVLLSFIYAFLEVGGAAKTASALFLQYPRTAILVVTMAINFGGLSVHMQAASLLGEIPVSFSKYLTAKLAQAACATAIIYVLSPLVFQSFT